MIIMTLFKYETKLEVQLTFEISRRSASTSNLPCVIIEEENQKKKKVSVEPQLSLFWEGLAHPKLEEILG